MRSVRRAGRVLASVAFAIALNMASGVSAHPVDDAKTYHWVSPPASRTTDNVPPEGRRVNISAGSPFQEFWTPDLQLTLFWPRGALGDGDVTLEASPVDPATLAPLPDGLVADGNAYRVQLDPVRHFATPASVTLKVPIEGSRVFHSSDGNSWRQLRPGSTEPGRAVAQLETSGYVVAVSDHIERQGLVTLRSLGAGALGGAVTVGTLLSWRRRRTSTKSSDSLRTSR